MKRPKSLMLNDEVKELKVTQQTENTITFSDQNTDITSNMWFDLQNVR
jgi:hypothetical protein